MRALDFLTSHMISWLILKSYRRQPPKVLRSKIYGQINKSWDFVNTMNDSSSKIGQVFECSMSKIEVV